MNTHPKAKLIAFFAAVAAFSGIAAAQTNWAHTDSMQDRGLSWDKSSVRREGAYTFVMVKDQSEQQEHPGAPVFVHAINCKARTVSVSQMGFWSDGAPRPELSEPNSERILEKYDSSLDEPDLLSIKELAEVLCK